jgi:hypothetical protein
MMRVGVSALALALALAPSGCAVVISGAAAISSGGDSKHPEPRGCGTVVGALVAGSTIDATIAAVAATGETFSTTDRFIVGLAVVDVVLATVLTVKACRD